MTEQPQELGEYHYYVSGMEITAQMTPEMAEKVGAKPIDEPLDEDPDNHENNEANRLSTHMKEPSAHGVQRPEPPEQPDPEGKSRIGRNKRTGRE